MEVKRHNLPGSCFFCQSITSGLWCEKCETDFITRGKRCPVCARDCLTDNICAVCLKNPPFFFSTITLFNYQYPINELIKAFKFSDHPELAKRFADKLIDKIRPMGFLPKTLIPVPLHKSRQRERGYNQSLELAKRISNKLNIELDFLSCKRIINTEPQSTLPIKTRKTNVKNAFKLDAAYYANRHVALIDDVVTSGHTVNEIAKLLKKAGCARVDVWSIAKT